MSNGSTTTWRVLSLAEKASVERPLGPRALHQHIGSPESFIVLLLLSLLRATLGIDPSRVFASVCLFGMESHPQAHGRMQSKGRPGAHGKKMLASGVGVKTKRSYQIVNLRLGNMH